MSKIGKNSHARDARPEKIVMFCFFYFLLRITQQRSDPLNLVMLDTIG
jgi:hypothetical protein